MVASKAGGSTPVGTQTDAATDANPSQPDLNPSPDPGAAVAAEVKVAGSTDQDSGGSDKLTRDEKAQLKALQAKADKAAARRAGAGETVLLSVQEPHESMTYGGVTIGREPTEVPASQYGVLASAAADAGVTITAHDAPTQED